MLSFFPRGVLDEILNLIESVSDGFPSYFNIAESDNHVKLSSVQLRKYILYLCSSNIFFCPFRANLVVNSYSEKQPFLALIWTHMFHLL